MSKYTTQVRYICETLAGLSESANYSSVDSVIEAAAPKIFDFEFPIFDEAYREELEHKILKHFYLREIGAETVGIWKLWLAERLQTIMPGMNKLYESNLIEFNPLYDTDIRTERTGTEEGTSKESSKDNTSGTGSTIATNTGTDWNLHSDTPQGGITGLDNGDYLSSADKTTTEGSSSGSSTTSASSSGSRDAEHSGRTTYIERIVGKRGGASYAQMIRDLRESFLNVDQLVFNELEDLFFMLW